MLSGIGVAAAFLVGFWLLARLVSPAAAVTNLAITAALALGLILQGLLDTPAVAYVALLLTAVSFALRWGINGVLWLHRYRRHREPSPRR